MTHPSPRLAAQEKRRFLYFDCREGAASFPLQNKDSEDATDVTAASGGAWVLG